MQSTSARTSKVIPDQYAVNSDETIKSHTDFIPDISSPSSFTQSVFQTLNDSEVAQQTLSVSDKATTLKCILLGDSNVGKSSLVISYTSNGFPDHHKSTAFDIYKGLLLTSNLIFFNKFSGNCINIYLFSNTCTILYVMPHVFPM